MNEGVADRCEVALERVGADDRHRHKPRAKIRNEGPRVVGVALPDGIGNDELAGAPDCALQPLLAVLGRRAGPEVLLSRVLSTGSASSRARTGLEDQRHLGLALPDQLDRARNVTAD